MSSLSHKGGLTYLFLGKAFPVLYVLSTAMFFILLALLFLFLAFRGNDKRRKVAKMAYYNAAISAPWVLCSINSCLWQPILLFVAVAVLAFVLPMLIKGFDWGENLPSPWPRRVLTAFPFLTLMVDKLPGELPMLSQQYILPLLLMVATLIFRENYKRRTNDEDTFEDD